MKSLFSVEWEYLCCVVTLLSALLGQLFYCSWWTFLIWLSILFVDLGWYSWLTFTWSYFLVSMWFILRMWQIVHWSVSPTSAVMRSRELFLWLAWSFQLWFYPESPGSAGNDPAHSLLGKGLNSKREKSLWMDINILRMCLFWLTF